MLMVQQVLRELQASHSEPVLRLSLEGSLKGLSDLFERVFGIRLHRETIAEGMPDLLIRIVLIAYGLGHGPWPSLMLNSFVASISQLPLHRKYCDLQHVLKEM